MSAPIEARQDQKQAPEQANSQSSPEREDRENATVDPAKRRRIIVIGSVIALILVLGCVGWWSLSAATGDRASVLPAENATGNYVKVIQRLPVRIRLDPVQDGIEKVRPGMSVEPTVHF
jgi:hypothetical protein